MPRACTSASSASTIPRSPPRRYVGFGEALYRLDQDDSALQAWQEATRLPENPSTYLAWRNVAAARVRAQDLRGAFDAYKEAEKRAPEQDRAEIANRLGLAVQGARGHERRRPLLRPGARGRRACRSRSLIVAITAIVSLTSSSRDRWARRSSRCSCSTRSRSRTGSCGACGRSPSSTAGSSTSRSTCTRCGSPDRSSSACTGDGASWRSTCCSPPAGRWPRSRSATARFAVGASGAIFGLFGLLFAVERVHKPILDRQSRAFLGQLGGLLVINLIFGLRRARHRQLAHLGGLVTGIVVGVLLRADARADHALDVDEARASRAGWSRSSGPRATGRSGWWACSASSWAFAALWALGLNSWG